MAHTFTVYFLGKYRPASFQGPTFEAAFFRCAEAIADMDDEAAALKLADWMSEVAAIAKPPKGRVSSYVSWAIDDGRIGLRWRKEAHDPWLDRALSGMPACPGLKYDLATVGDRSPADPVEAHWVGAARAAASLSGEA